MAPSSKRSNCWQFLVVDDKDMLEKLSIVRNGGSFSSGCCYGCSCDG